MTKEDDMTFSERLKALSKKKHLSQRDIASRAGITQATVSRYFTGEREPKSSTVAVLADILGTTSGYLLSGDEEKNKSTDTVDFQTFCRITDASARNFTEQQRIQALKLLFAREREKEDEYIAMKKEVFDENFTWIKEKIKTEEDFTEFILSDMSRSMDTMERRMYVHILSQGVFVGNTFRFSDTVSFPDPAFYHRLSAVTYPPDDYFFVRQKEDAWTREPGRHRDTYEEWPVCTVNRKYMSLLPDGSYAKGCGVLTESHVEADSSCKIFIPVNGKDDLLVLPEAGDAMYKNRYFSNVQIDILKDERRFNAFLAMIKNV